MINLSQQPLLDTSTYVHIGTYMNKKKVTKNKRAEHSHCHYNGQKCPLKSLIATGRKGLQLRLA